MKRLLSIFCLVGCLLIGTTSQAQTLSDSATISLLTCTPGDYVYANYGHSAIRVQDPVKNIDWTFNYGIFSFDTEDFYLKFVKGETDYQLGVEYTQSFLFGSASIGRITYEQPLHLTREQKQLIFDALMLNYRPENRFYRYNFVFDNCATRPYHLLQRALGDQLSTVNCQLSTYRSLISHYTMATPWVDAGVNLIFGKDADVVMTPEQRLFLPEELMHYVQNVTLANGEPLTNAEPVAPFVIKTAPWYLSPIVVLVLMCLLIVLMSYLDLRHRKVSWWLDGILFAIYGVLGTIGCFLTFFSLHPLVGENYNLLFYNPLMLILPVLMCFEKGRTLLKKGGLIITLYFYIALVIRIFSGQAWHWLLLVSILHYLRIRLVWYREIFILGANPYRKKIAVIALTLLACVLPTKAQAEERLTVVVQVNGLNQQALADLIYMPRGGWHVLQEEAQQATIFFPQLVFGGAETLATVVTGTTPATHGIASNTYFNRTERAPFSIFEDKTVKGIGTDKAYSPTALLSLSFADEFRLRYPTKNSKIYACGVHPEQTILLAGHSANACAWINPKTLKWVTTTYYPEGLPAAADKMNVHNRMNNMTKKQWKSYMQPSIYVHASEKEIQNHGYKYDLKKVFTQSPMANKAVIELALMMQQTEKLGVDNYPDLLAIELNVTTPAATTDLMRSAEQEDVYGELNKELATLIEQLTKRVGKDNFTIILFGTPHFGAQETVRYEWQAPHHFNLDRAAALINTYLMAIYGHERWVDGGYMHSIYLNRTLIEQKRIPLMEIQQQVSNFLLEFEGVKEAFPYSYIPFLQGDGEHAQLRETVNKRCFGDVIFTLQPRYNTVDTQPTTPIYIYSNSRSTLPQTLFPADQLKEILLP